MMSYNKYKNILESNKISLKVRIRLFNVYIASIFLYNSELWTLTKKLNNAIDIFQRALLKKILKIQYPFIIRNEIIYSRVQQNKWSELIQIRRLSWLGHLMRLDPSTPAQIALQESQVKNEKKKQGNRLTWIKLIESDIKIIKKTYIYKTHN